jgi:flagellar hook-length control protein FliK
MNTPAITAAPPTTPAQPNRAVGTPDDAESGAASFSHVLGDQRSTHEHSGSATVKPDSTKTGPSHHAAPHSDDITAASDEELAKLAGEQGLSLPQITLDMAAHAMAGTPKAVTTNAGKSTPQAALTATASDAVENEKAKVLAANTTLSARGTAAIGRQVPDLVRDTPNPKNGRALPPTSGNTTKADAPDTIKTKSSSTQASQTAPLITTHAVGTVAINAPLQSDGAVNLDDTSGTSTVQGMSAPAAMMPAQVQTAGPTPLPGGTPGIATPLQQPQWGQDFSQQVLTLVQTTHNQHQTAQLRLDPPDLGPLHITININDNIAHAVFSSAHASVRQAIENALPQLQQQLAQAGISLGQASVNDQSQQQTFSGQERKSGGGAIHAVSASGVHSGGGVSTTHTATRPPRNPNAVIDTFA